MNNAVFRRALPAADVPEGSMRAVDIDGRSILICHAQGSIYAVDNVCSHAEAKLSEGRLRGFRVICPLHGASFDCRNGAVLGAPATQALKTHEIRCVAGFIEVAIS